jgi:hypothetical protein
MQSPEFRDHITIRTDRVFEQVYEIQDLVRVNELAFRRDLRAQRLDEDLKLLVTEEEAKFQEAVTEASVSRYNDDSLFDTLLTPQSLNAFSMEPVATRATRMGSGLFLMLQRVSGVDSQQTPFHADGILLARAHSRGDLGYTTFPSSRIVRISRPENRSDMMLADRDKVLSPHLANIEETVGLIHNYYKVMAERAEPDAPRRLPRIARPILLGLPSEPDDPDRS